ncbi:MAG: hypothetical protein JWP03_1461 [Phycisphaerales bacterium]|nr:hypothetical protein [Phycisphaerales bacterium]
MCGFAGVVAWDERYRVTRETLAKMSARVAHRGPDGEGMHISADGPIGPDRPQIALAHRRLAILDPDPRANQPFMDYAGRWIVFNGEIYNFRELRAELTKLQPDYPWRTNCDTEVLLAAYGQWGENCVEHLNGMFAFVVWDEPKKKLFLARDRMGQKPLYVAYLNGNGERASIRDWYQRDRPPAAVAFASEIGALLEVPWIDRTIDPRALHQYLSVGYITGGTIHRGIEELRPSERLSIQWREAASLNLSRYFHQKPRPDAPLSDSLAIETTRHLVEQAVQRQLVSDVPIGCFLSGGVDSSIIAAAMRRSGGAVETFSIGFDDRRYDERSFAKAVAQHLGTKHHEFCVAPRAAEDLPKLAAVFGQPFADSSALPTHYLSRETRSHVKVALSGDGGDELFGGYDRYRAMLAGEKFRRVPAGVLKIIASSSQRLPGSHPKSTGARLKRFTATLSDPAYVRYARFVRLFDSETVEQLLTSELRAATRDCDTVEGMYHDYFQEDEVVRAALLVDRLHYLPGDLLTKVDRASMLHALEVRSPFMDHELVQFAAGLTTDQLLKGGPKRMLREAFAGDLPAWVFKRKKMGFAVPIGDWFRGELRGMLRDHLFAANSFAAGHFNRPVVERLVEEHETGRVDHSQRLYALLMLELWWKALAPSPS